MDDTLGSLAKRRPAANYKTRETLRNDKKSKPEDGPERRSLPKRLLQLGRATIERDETTKVPVTARRKWCEILAAENGGIFNLIIREETTCTLLIPRGASKVAEEQRRGEMRAWMIASAMAEEHELTATGRSATISGLRTLSLRTACPNASFHDPGGAADDDGAHHSARNLQQSIGRRSWYGCSPQG